MDRVASSSSPQSESHGQWPGTGSGLSRQLLNDSVLNYGQGMTEGIVLSPERDAS